MQDVVIVAATRTAVGSFQGSLANIPAVDLGACLLYTSPSPRDVEESRMPSSA